MNSNRLHRVVTRPRNRWPSWLLAGLVGAIACAPDFAGLGSGSEQAESSAGAAGAAGSRGGRPPSLGMAPDCGGAACGGARSGGPGSFGGRGDPGAGPADAAGAGGAGESGGSNEPGFGDAGGPGETGRGGAGGSGSWTTGGTSNANQGGSSSSGTGQGGRGGSAAASGGSGPNGSGGTLNTGTGGSAALPTLRFDFETAGSLQGWRLVDNPVPADEIDQLLQSTSAAHHGFGSLTMYFDGKYTPFTSGEFYGTYTPTGLPPAGAVVSIWIKTTAANASVQFYVQRAPDYTWITLRETALAVETWQSFEVTIPKGIELYRFGLRMATPLDYRGNVYVDEIRW